MKENGGKDHDDGRRCVEKCGGGCYFGDFDRGCVTECEEEQAEQTVTEEKRDVRLANPEGLAVRRTDQESHGDRRAQHAQEDQRIAGQSHRSQYCDKGAVQPP